jgi:hypothetical protein
LKVKLIYDAADQPVTLQAQGLPESLREHQMVECTLSATNTSKKNLTTKSGEWFTLDIEKAGYFMTFGPPDKRDFLKPGETVSQVVRLFVIGGEKELRLRWTFQQNQSAPDSP